MKKMAIFEEVTKKFNMGFGVHINLFDIFLLAFAKALCGYACRVLNE